VSPASHRPAARWLVAGLWAAAILVATSWPNPHVPDVPSGDKVVHVALYAGLAWLVVRALGPATQGTRVALVVVAVTAFAAADEWHQRFIPGRSTSTADWAADTGGATLGALAAAAVQLAAARRAGVRRA